VLASSSSDVSSFARSLATAWFDSEETSTRDSTAPSAWRATSIVHGGKFSVAAVVIRFDETDSVEELEGTDMLVQVSVMDTVSVDFVVLSTADDMIGWTISEQWANHVLLSISHLLVVSGS